MRHLLIDAGHLAGRSRAAMHEMRTSKGWASGVVFGFLKGLGYIRSTQKIEWSETIICWDYGRSEYRKQLYPEYKAHRKVAETDAEKLEQLAHNVQIASLVMNLYHLGIKQVIVPGVEADDLLGIFANDLSHNGNDVLIHSGDHDVHQLSSPRVSILDPKKGLLTEQAIEELWGIHVRDIPYYKALVGDSSDNIKGVPGIGDKRALEIITAKNLQLPCKWDKKVQDHKEIIDRNLSLCTIPRVLDGIIYTGITCDAIVEQYKRSPPQRNTKAFIEFLKEWELTSILENVSRW